MLNKVFIEGRLVADPELRRTASGKPVTTVRIACARNSDSTDFFDVVAWNGSAENLCKFTKKGMRVIVDGRLNTREYEQDGKKRTATEIVADKVHIIDRIEKKQERTEVSEDEELPF